MKRPSEQEYAPYYRNYVALVPETGIVEVLESQNEVLRHVAARLPRDREMFSYAPGKWTIRQVMGHMGDAERVFGFRAYCFGRGDQTPLPGFDENVYVDRSSFNDSSFADLVEDFAHCRISNVRAFKGFNEDRWSHTGVANQNPITVRGLAFIMAGHVRHHLRVLHERYGVETGS